MRVLRMTEREAAGSFASAAGNNLSRQVSTIGLHCFRSARASHWIRPGWVEISEEAMGAEGMISKDVLSNA